MAVRFAHVNATGADHLCKGLHYRHSEMVLVFVRRGLPATTV